MQYKVSANISLKTDNGQYRFSTVDIDIKGDKMLTLDQMFEHFKQAAQERKMDINRIVNLRVTEVEESAEFPVKLELRQK